MKIQKSYKTEIKPNNKQRTLLEKSVGTARFAYNWGLSYRKNLYESDKKSISYFDHHKVLCSIKKKEYPWMYEVSKCASQCALRDLDVAFKNFFRGLKQGKKVGFPKFKSKHKSTASFHLDSNSFKVTDNKVMIAKIGFIRLKEKGYIPTENVKYNSITISKAAGRWYVSVQVEQDMPEPNNALESVLGVDVGIKTLAACSNGQIFENHKYLNKSKKKLAHAQKNLARKKFNKETKKSSNNRNKAKLKLQKIYHKISNQRKDAIHKMTSALVKTKPRYLVMEDLNVTGMMKNHNLAGAIGDASFCEIKRQLTYKTLWYGGSVLEVDRFFPSSKTCSICGSIKDDLTLSDRIYTCLKCSSTMDRDLNASVNLEKFGMSTLSSREINACGESVRLLNC
jgi:putative transposase